MSSRWDDLAQSAARHGPTIYAKLMQFALDEPRQELYEHIEKEVRRFTGDLAEQMLEQLRKAYVAGVADGYREAIKQENDITRAALDDEKEAES